MLTASRSCALVLAAFAVTLVAIWRLRPAATRRGWVDAAGSDPLKIHRSSPPVIGGIAMALGTAASVLLVGDHALVSPSQVLLLLLLGAGMVGLGFCDDLFRLRPRTRVSAEVSAAILLVLGGLGTGLFDGSGLSASPAGVTLLAALVVLFIVGGINALNMQDGIDGLAAGLAVISCVGFIVVGTIRGDALAVQIPLALGGSLVAFLIFNRPPAAVFMGDNGSYFVGALLAAIALLLSLPRGTLWAFAGGALLVGLPVVDTAIIIGRRIRRGHSPFVGDREHLYDRLIARRLTPRQVILVSYLVQIVAVAGGALLLVLP